MAIERIDSEQIKRILKLALPAKVSDIDSLFLELSPQFDLDRDEEKILFQANTRQNVMTIGLKCTVRLQAYALAASVIIDAVCHPSFLQMSTEERDALFRPAHQLLEWAVGRDLRHWVCNAPALILKVTGL